MSEKKKKEVRISDIFGGSLNLLGMKIDVGKLLSLAERPGELAEDIEKLRMELEKAGGKPIRVEGHIRTRPILGRRPGKWRPVELKIPVTKLEGELEPLVDVFDEDSNVRVLVEIPSHHEERDITLEYEKKNGGGELIVRGPEDYVRRVSIKEKLAAKLTGRATLRSLKSGIVNAELEKRK